MLYIIPTNSAQATKLIARYPFLRVISNGIVGRTRLTFLACEKEYCQFLKDSGLTFFLDNIPTDKE